MPAPDPEAGDSRGLLSENQVNDLRKVRAAEQWERIDTIVIGEGAQNFDRGWFNTWAQFANADTLQWFNGRNSNVPGSYVNQYSERTDWAQDIYQTLIEFLAPPGIGDIEEDQNDAQIVPTLFTQELPNAMGFSIRLAETDEIAQAAGSHFPSGFGVSYPSSSGAAAPSVFAGNQGEPTVHNGWKWPDPIRLAAKSKIQVIARVDHPLRPMLQTLPGPGAKLVPDGQGGQIRLPNWYKIRITMRGPRYLQLRGARSSA